MSAISPSRLDVSGIEFQVNNSGHGICVPITGYRRRIKNVGCSRTYGGLEAEGYDSDGELVPFYDEVVH